MSDIANNSNAEETPAVEETTEAASAATTEATSAEAHRGHQRRGDPQH